MVEFAQVVKAINYTFLNEFIYLKTMAFMLDQLNTDSFQNFQLRIGQFKFSWEKYQNRMIYGILQESMLAQWSLVFLAKSHNMTFGVIP
jgi:hypothetical protein